MTASPADLLAAVEARVAERQAKNAACGTGSESVLARCGADLRIARRAYDQAVRHKPFTEHGIRLCSWCAFEDSGATHFGLRGDDGPNDTERGPCRDYDDALATLADLAAT